MDDDAARRGARPVRVGMIIDSLNVSGGTENQILLLLRSLDPSRIRPSIGLLQGGDGERRVGDSADTCVLGIGRMVSPAGLRGLRRAVRWIRSSRLDVLVTFFRDANIVGTLAGRWSGVPVISSRRNQGYWHTPLERGVLRFLDRLTHSFVANSEATRRFVARVEGVPPDRIEVIPNALDVRMFRPRREERDSLRAALGLPSGTLLACVANLRPVKGHETLLRALSHSSDLRRACRLLLVGDGPLRSRLEYRSRELGLEPNVFFLGSRSDVPDILGAADIGVLASAEESSPNAVLEYMASGLPTVATDVGGVGELLSGGDVGLLVPPGDPVGFAESLSRLVASEPERLRMGAAARRYVVHRHSLDVVLDRWTMFLEAAVRRRAGRRTGT